MKLRRPQGLEPEPCPTMLRWIELRSKSFHVQFSYRLFQVLFVSSLIVIVVPPGGGKMAGQSDQGCQAEKGGAENGRKHHLSPVHVTSYLSMTQSGCSSGKAIRPTTAVAAMRSGLLTFQRNKTASEATPMRTVSQSPIAMRPSRMQAPRIVPIAAA